jgi:uncharacterized membrane protein (DUF106 family)
MNMPVPVWLITAPNAAIVIMAIAFVITLILQSTNRVIINRFIGLDNYRAMQKELSDFRKEQMAAARSNDTKQLEKLKKKQSQINAINAKIMKPQMIQLVISFCYMPVFIFVRSFFVDAQIGGVAGVAVIPYFGALSYMIWYMVAGFFMSIIVMRLFGTMPMT